jgi:hypothetical protein
MQIRNQPGNPKELTKSFGWGPNEVNVSHDIQEVLFCL